MSKQFYDLRGGGNRDTIVMIHGAGVTRKWWHPQVEEFSKGYRIIVPDLPGHGALEGERFSMETSLEYLKLIFETEIKGKAVLMGVSLGGYLAIQFAHLHPDNVTGMILCGSSANLSGLTGFSLKLSGFMLRRKGADWLKDATIRSYRKRVKPELIEPVLEAGIFPEAAIHSLFQTSGTNYYRLVKEFAGPILIANGEKDEINFKAEKKLAKFVPNARFSPIEGASHLTNLEKPEAFNQAVLEFLKQIG